MSDPLALIRSLNQPEGVSFSVSRLSYWFWQEYVDHDLRVQALIDQGQRLSPIFATVILEIFHRLFADPYPEWVRSDAPDVTWARTLHGCLDRSLDFELLVTETQGDPISSALATGELAQQCLSLLPGWLRSNPGQMGSSNQSSALERLSSEGKSLLKKSMGSACEKSRYQIQQMRSLMQPFQGGWDSAQGMERQGSFSEKLILSQRLQSNVYLRQIAELAGRMLPLMRIQQRSKIQQGYSQLTGIEIGHDLSRLLASELIQLADPERFPLFAKGYLERTLLQYQTEDQESLGQGPLVICVDVSGSMMGDPDRWAKAVALTLVHLAMEQQRHCRLIQFSETVKRFDDLSPNQSLSSILPALSEFFSGGGTNFMDPLTLAVEAVAREPELRQGDLIVITDGVGNLDPEFLQDFQLSQTCYEFSVYGILISASPQQQARERLQCFCDRIWQVQELSMDGSEIRELFAL